MKQIVDFKSEESISMFIKLVKAQMFDQGGVLNYNIILRKSSFLVFNIIASLLKSNENVN